MMQDVRTGKQLPQLICEFCGNNDQSKFLVFIRKLYKCSKEFVRCTACGDLTEKNDFNLLAADFENKYLKNGAKGIPIVDTGKADTIL